MVEDDDHEGPGFAQSASREGVLGGEAGEEGCRGAVTGEGVSEKEGQGAEEEEEVEEVMEETDEETMGKMSSMEQRLFKIRLKMNKVVLVCYVFNGVVSCCVCRVVYDGCVSVVRVKCM